MSVKLPPGITKATFDAAMKEFASVVGPNWALGSEKDAAGYLDPMDIGDTAEHMPSGAVAPASIEELAGVLKVANRRRIPVWPISMGKNFAYGTSAPRMPGTLVLDLRRMNRVLEINEDVGYALVEPGVSFFDFAKALEGKRVWMSGPAHSWGSVIGNALEHGVGYTPYGVHADMICGMEVMLADGSLVRTGMGAVKDSKEWQAYKLGYGPVWDGLFTQSNLGIVTKMGVWLMPEPEGMAGVSIKLPRDEDLTLLVDTLRPLRLNDTINATYTIANGMRQASRVGVRKQLYTGPGAVPKDVIGKQLEKQGDTWWSVIFNLFDRPDVLDIRLDVIRKAFERIPGARITMQRWRRGEPKAPWMRQDVGLGPLGIVDWHGGRGGHTDFGPVMAPVGSRVDQVYRQVEKRFYEHGVDPYVGMFGLGQRAIVMVADLIWNRDDNEMTKRCRELFRALAKDMAGIGVGLYRSHLTFMDDAAAMQTFNDGALLKLNNRIKMALDPNGVIAPGKQGVWGAVKKV